MWCQILWLAFVATLVLPTKWSTATNPILLKLTTKKPIAVIGEKFLSISIDPFDFLDHHEYELTEQLENSARVARSLAPAYVRFAGLPGTPYTFERSIESRARNTNENKKNSTLTATQWTLLNQWSKKAHLDVVASIELEAMGDEDEIQNSRNFQNALDFIAFSERMGYEVSWQLGYECQTRCNISASDLGNRVKRLRNTLDNFTRYSNSIVLGPDITRCDTEEQREYLGEYFHAAGTALSAITWQPVLFERMSTVPDSTRYNHLATEKQNLLDLLPSFLKTRPLWIAESSSKVHLPSYSGGFAWTRALGDAAKLGAQVLMRQATDLFQATPDYWVSFLHKSLVGRQVLETRIQAGNGSRTFFYCHCTRPSGRYGRGSVTIFGVNTGEPVTVNVEGIKIETLHEYILQPDFNPSTKLFANTLRLNDDPLGLPILLNDSDFLAIEPRILINTEGLKINLGSNRIGFWVLPDIKVKSCMGHYETSTLQKFQRRKSVVNEVNSVYHELHETISNPTEEERELKKYIAEMQLEKNQGSRGKRRRSRNRRELSSTGKPTKDEEHLSLEALRLKRDPDKKLPSDSLIGRRDAVLKRRSRVEEERERRVERKIKKKDESKKELHHQPTVVPSRITNSGENTFYGFVKLNPVENFPKGDIYMETGDSIEDIDEDYDYVKDDEEVTSEAQQKRRGKGGKMKSEAPSIDNSESDDVWLEVGTDYRSYLPNEFFESVQMAVARRAYGSSKGFSELSEAESMEKIADESEDSDEDEEKVKIVRERQPDEVEEKRAKERTVETLYNYYGSEDKATDDESRMERHGKFASKRRNQYPKEDYFESILSSNQETGSKRRKSKIETIDEDDDLADEGTGRIRKSYDRLWIDSSSHDGSRTRGRSKRHAEDLEKIFNLEMIQQDNGNSKDCNCRVIRSLDQGSNSYNRRIGRSKVKKNGNVTPSKRCEDTVHPIPPVVTSSGGGEDEIERLEETSNIDLENEHQEFVHEQDAQDEETRSIDKSSGGHETLDSEDNQKIDLSSEDFDGDEKDHSLDEDIVNYDDSEKDELSPIVKLVRQPEEETENVETHLKGTTETIERDDGPIVEEEEAEEESDLSEDVKESEKSVDDHVLETEEFAKEPAQDPSSENVKSSLDENIASTDENIPSESLVTEPSISSLEENVRDDPQVSEIAPETCEPIVGLALSQDESKPETEKTPIEPNDDIEKDETSEHYLGKKPESDESQSAEKLPIDSKHLKPTPRVFKNKDEKESSKTKLKSFYKADEAIKAREARLAAKTEALLAFRKINENKRVKKLSSDFQEYQKKRAEQLEKVKEKLITKREKLFLQYRKELEELANTHDEEKKNVKRREILEKISADADLRDVVDPKKLAYVLMYNPDDYEVGAPESEENEEADRVNKKFVPVLEVERPIHRVRQKTVPSRIHPRTFYDPELLRCTNCGKTVRPVIRSKNPHEDEYVSGRRRYSDDVRGSGKSYYTLVDEVDEPWLIEYRKKPHHSQGYHYEDVSEPEYAHNFKKYTVPRRHEHSHDNQEDDCDHEKEGLYQVIHHFDHLSDRQVSDPLTRQPLRRKIYAIDPSTYKGGDPILEVHEDDIDLPIRSHGSQGNVYRVIWEPRIDKIVASDQLTSSDGNDECKDTEPLEEDPIVSDPAPRSHPQINNKNPEFLYFLDATKQYDLLNKYFRGGSLSSLINALAQRNIQNQSTDPTKIEPSSDNNDSTTVSSVEILCEQSTIAKGFVKRQETSNSWNTTEEETVTAENSENFATGHEQSVTRTEVTEHVNDPSESSSHDEISEKKFNNVIMTAEPNNNANNPQYDATKVADEDLQLSDAENKSEKVLVSRDILESNDQDEKISPVVKLRRKTKRTHGRKRRDTNYAGDFYKKRIVNKRGIVASPSYKEVEYSRPRRQFKKSITDSVNKDSFKVLPSALFSFTLDDDHLSAIDENDLINNENIAKFKHRDAHDEHSIAATFADADSLEREHFERKNGFYNGIPWLRPYNNLKSTYYNRNSIDNVLGSDSVEENLTSKKDKHADKTSTTPAQSIIGEAIPKLQDTVINGFEKVQNLSESLGEFVESFDEKFNNTLTTKRPRHFDKNIKTTYTHNFFQSALLNIKKMFSFLKGITRILHV